jgi:hypothetical protein
MLAMLMLVLVQMESVAAAKKATLHQRAEQEAMVALGRFSSSERPARLCCGCCRENSQPLPEVPRLLLRVRGGLVKIAPSHVAGRRGRLGAW